MIAPLPDDAGTHCRAGVPKSPCFGSTPENRLEFQTDDGPWQTRDRAGDVEGGLSVAD